jgi:hypothetical protein
MMMLDLLAEIGKLRNEILALQDEVVLWKERWKAEHDDHEATIKAFDREMGEGP